MDWTPQDSVLLERNRVVGPSFIALLFSYKRGHHTDRSSLYSLSLGEGSSVEVVLTISIAPMACWNLPSGRLDFINLSLICGNLPRSAVRFFPNCRKEVVSLLLVWFYSPHLRSVYLLLDAQMGKTPHRSLGIWCWIPQLPQRYLCS